MRSILKAAFLSTTFSLLCAAEEGRISFSKAFPNSTPPWVKITLERSGDGIYIEAPDDPQPLQFKLTAAETSAIFGLAEKLGYFSRPLESNLPVARMGDKTFRFEVEGKKPNEVKFNYSTDLDAQALTDWFERISESERLLIELERAARFDKLGVNRVILLIQSAHERNRLMAPAQFLKWLDRVAKNESYLNMARERAATLAAIFRNPSEPKAEAGGKADAAAKP